MSLLPRRLSDLFDSLHEDGGSRFLSSISSTGTDTDTPEIPTLEPNRSDSRSFSYGNLNSLDSNNIQGINNRNQVNDKNQLAIPQEQLVLDDVMGYIPKSTYDLWHNKQETSKEDNNSTTKSASMKKVKPKVRYS